MPVAFETSTRNFVPPHKLWTREECDVLAQTGVIDLERYELLDGELVPKVSKKHPHGRATARLVRWLRSVFGEECVLQENSIRLRPEDNPTNEPEPDAIVLAGSYLEMSLTAGPNELRLVAEVSYSTLDVDLGIKARLYARSEIAEYWVLDVNGRRLIVHREPAGGRYTSVAAYGKEERVSTLAEPARDVQVGDLL